MTKDKPDLVDGILKFQKFYEEQYNEVDDILYTYPADVQSIIKKLCELWYLKPPRQKKGKGYWIEGARNLIDSCAEYGAGLLDDIRDDYDRNDAHYFVTSPNSLVNVARAIAGEKRGKEQDEIRKRNRYKEWE